MDSRRRSGSGSESGSSYCTNCGEKLSPSANFCPDCGASCETGSRSGASSSTRTRTTNTNTSREGLEFRVTKAIENDWEVEHDFGDHVVLIRRSLGSTGTHILIAFMTIWWTMGMGNALYAAYCYYSNAERRVLWADHAKQSETSSSGVGAGAGAGVRDSTRETAGSSSSGSLGTTILLWFGALIMVAAAQASATVLWTVLFAVVALLFALSGASSLSPVRRRLEERRSITDNGWTRSVRERSVVNSDETCTACAGRVGHGVERTYHKDFSVLGVPLTTSEHGTNYYCRRCANGEVPSSNPTPESESESVSNSNSRSDSGSDSSSNPPGRTRASDSGTEQEQNQNQNQGHERAHLERSDEDGDERQTQKRERKQEQERSQHADQNQTKEDVDISVDHERTSATSDSDHDHDHDREPERNTEPN